jgi:hypothetical protein
MLLVGGIELTGTRTDARGYVRATLLVALGASVTRHAGNAVLARALSGSLIARLARRTDRVAVAC